MCRRWGNGDARNKKRKWDFPLAFFG